MFGAWEAANFCNGADRIGSESVHSIFFKKATYWNFQMLFFNHLTLFVMIFIARRTWNEVKAIYFSPHQISILPKLFSTYKINRPRCCQCDRDFAIFKGLCGKCCENIWQLFRLFWKHRFLVQAAVARQVVTLVFSLNCMLLGRSSISSPLVLSRLTVWGLYARKLRLKSHTDWKFIVNDILELSYTIVEPL